LKREKRKGEIEGETRQREAKGRLLAPSEDWVLALDSFQAFHDDFALVTFHALSGRISKVSLEIITAKGVDMGHTERHRTAVLAMFVRSSRERRPSVQRSSVGAISGPASEVPVIRRTGNRFSVRLAAVEFKAVRVGEITWGRVQT
jgi:hypothetical protein